MFERCCLVVLAVTEAGSYENKVIYSLSEINNTISD